MKCTNCGEKAVINMPHHNLGLCKDHFLNWVPKRTEWIINKYDMFSNDERILVAVSGGKDSLSLWELFSRLGYKADGLYIALGIDGGLRYSVESQRYVEKFARENQHTLHIVDIQQETGRTIPEWGKTTIRGKGRACSICGLVKRHEMNRIAQELGYDVLATGHNLDDEAAVLLGNTLKWHGNYLLRQWPVLKGENGLIRKVKPLCRFYEREVAAYAFLQGIEYIHEECPHSTDAASLEYKRILTQLENSHPGTKHAFYLNFLKARSQGLFMTQEEMRPTLHPCLQCGQPTSVPEYCSFCRMLMKNKIFGDNKNITDQEVQ